jgi:DNA polymerase III delta prime subunit
MGRPERPLDPTDDPVVAFAHDLRELRKRAGSPSYRELARTAMFAPSVLSSAASGYRLPTLPVALAFVTSCGGDLTAWERRWRTVADFAPAGQNVPARIPAETGPAGTSPAGPRREKFAAAPPARTAPALLTRTCTVQASPATAEITVATPGQPRSYASSACTRTRPAQLPLGPATFIGRGAQLISASRIAEATGRVRVPLMISGPAGIGKTAFALRLADELAAGFPDGQLYADLGICGQGSQSPESIMTGFLRALEVPESLIPADRSQLVGLYRSLLAQRRLFVLLEDAYEESQIRPLLAQSSHTQFVLTGSARLLGLDGMLRLDLPVLDRMESVALLGRLAGRERIDAEDKAADAIAAACGDLPFALNIIGRKLAARPQWTAGYAATLLADRARLMDVLGVGDVSVQARYEAAYRLLPSACRRAMHQLGRREELSVTATGLAAAMRISIDAAEDVLEALVDSGLITRARAVGRYAISNLVSAFAEGAQPDLASLTTALPSLRGRDLVPAPGAHV